MKRKIALLVVVAVLAILMLVTVVACTDTPEQQKYGKGLNVSFLKDLTIDLDGVTALAIEKRATVKPVANGARNVAYADETEEKNKLVGEKEDMTIEEIVLRTKLGEIYNQDDLQAEFNKLCVSGDFIYFELIPIDVDEFVDEYGVYYYYNESDLKEDGTPKDGTTLRSVYVSRRDGLSGEALANFEKTSTPSPVAGSYVYSVESEKIYDLSDVGYEVLGKDVVRISGRICRAYVNAEGEYETKEVLNDYHTERTTDIRVDKYGNVFGKGVAAFIDAESRVYIEKDEYNPTVWYVVDEDGQVVQLNSDGTVKWIDADGLRELQPSDNMDAVWRHPSLWQFLGIKNGVADFFDRYVPSIWNMEAWRIESTVAVAVVFPIDENIEFSIIWFDTTMLIEDETKETYLIPAEYYYICENANTTYNDVEWSSVSKKGLFTTIDANGETTYEFYWDDVAQEVKIRIQEEIIAQPKEVKKFQPIGG